MFLGNHNEIWALEIKSVKVIHSLSFVRVNLLYPLLSAVFLGQLICFIPPVNEAFICIRFAGFLHAPSFAETFDVTVWCVGSSIIKHAFTTAWSRPGGTNMGLERVIMRICWQGYSGFKFVNFKENCLI